MTSPPAPVASRQVDEAARRAGVVRAAKQRLFRLGQMMCWSGCFCTCNQDTTPLTLAFSTAHFEYWSEQPDLDCSALPQVLEDHLSAAGDYLGLPEPNAPIVLRRYASRESLRQFGRCSPAARACYFADTGVETTDAINRHELIHAYTQAWGDAHPLLEEGLAEALTCEDDHVLSPNLGVDTAFSSQHWRGAQQVELSRLYAIAARFVAHVLRDAGPEAFARWYQEMPADAEPEQARTTFSMTYGADLDDVLRRAIVDPDPTSSCLYALDCATAPPSPTASSAERSATCQELLPWRRVDLEQATLVADRSRVTEPSPLVAVRSCDGASIPYPRVNGFGPIEPDAGDSFFTLAAGSYLVWNPDLGRTLEPLPVDEFLTLPDGCASAETLETDDSGEHFFGFSREALGPKERVLRWADRQNGDTDRYVECSDGLWLSRCQSCDMVRCEVICDTNVRAGRLPAAERTRLLVRVEGAEFGWLRVFGAR